jgi:hypothetical protein
LFVSVPPGLLVRLACLAELLDGVRELLLGLPRFAELLGGPVVVVRPGPPGDVGVALELVRELLAEELLRQIGLFPAELDSAPLEILAQLALEPARDVADVAPGVDLLGVLVLGRVVDDRTGRGGTP